MDNEKLIERLNRFKPICRLENEFKMFKNNLCNSDIIVAFPGSFFFIGEHSVMHGQPALNMSIPLYGYVGATESKREGISIEMWKRNLEIEEFEKFKWREREREYLEKELEDILRAKNIKPKYELFSLLEVPPGCGLNSSGALSAGISVCIGILNGMFSPYDVQRWQTIKRLEELKKDKEFKEAFEMAWQFDWAIQRGSSGIGPLVSLVGFVGEPIIYFLENDELGEQKWESQWHAYFLSEFCSRTDISRFKKWPFALIYSGSPSFTKEAFDEIKRESTNASIGIEKFVEQLKTREIPLEKITTPLQSVLKTEIMKELEEGLIGKEKLEGPNREFINKVKQSQEHRPKNISAYLLERIWGVLGGFSIIAIGNIVTQPERTVDMMNICQSVLSALGISTPKINDICKEFQSHAANSHSIIGAKLTGSGAGGDVIVLSPYEDKIDIIKKIIEEKGYTVHFKSWESKQVEKTILKEPKYFPRVMDIKEKEKENAYVGVISKKIPESPNYKKSGEFSKEALEQQRGVLSDVEKAIRIAKDKDIDLDMLVLPEYSLPPEADEQYFKKIREKLTEISKEKDIIIVGGSYLSKNLEDICLVFLPSGETRKIWRLNRCNDDPKEFKEGCGVGIFKNSRIGDFCVVVCFDYLSEKIPEVIQKAYRREHSFTLIIVSQCRDIERYKRRSDELANPKGKKSNQGLLAYVILADSYHGLAYYAAPVRRRGDAKKEDFCKPILEKDNYSIFRLPIKELKNARTPGIGSKVLYSINPK